MELGVEFLDTNSKHACTAECCNSPVKKVRQQGRKKQNSAGRIRNDETGKWQLISCIDCGAKHIHVGCLTGRDKHRDYKCRICIPSIQEESTFVIHSTEQSQAPVQAERPVNYRPRRRIRSNRTDPPQEGDTSLYCEPASVRVMSDHNTGTQNKTKVVNDSGHVQIRQKRVKTSNEIEIHFSVILIICVTICIFLGMDLTFGSL